MLFTTTNFIAWTDISPVPLSYEAFAGLNAVVCAGQLLHCRLERRPSRIAEQGVLFSETNRYLICIGDEGAAKSEYVQRVGQALV
ncbi:hypothetical protein UP10_34720 [Bradyrhizobium sp. LTSPM299]|nr:hypothetical protein UP10_34720 [Bradyrhizobium sp. LTSPM299]